MSSTTRLLVLGAVRVFQPVHGYEVRRELLSWRAEEWASVKSGSIYNALKTLTQDGLLEVVGTDSVGGRPERTTYRLTAAGDAEFRSLLREEWWTLRSPIDPLMAAVSFLNYVTRDEAIAALEHRALQIQSFVRHIEFATEEHTGVDSPLHVREMHHLLNARVLAEVEWGKQLIARLRNHEYTTADDPPVKWATGSDRVAGGPADRDASNTLSRAAGRSKPPPRATRPARATRATRAARASGEATSEQRANNGPSRERQGRVGARAATRAPGGAVSRRPAGSAARGASRSQPRGAVRKPSR